MMKKSVWAILLLCSYLTVFSQNEWICRTGFTYDISQFIHWGKGKPVITEVYAYSPAEQAGLKPGDVIEEIDGIPVKDLSQSEMEQLMNEAGRNEVILTISNLTSSSKQILVKKQCKLSNAITEDQLAMAFCMYSLETTSERTFICPFKTTTTSENIDFSLFKTFGFYSIDENNTKLDKEINEYIKKELSKKGLSEQSNPDMLIETFYFFDKNANYRGPNRLLVEKESTYRYDFGQQQMVKLPFLNHAASESEAEYTLQLGIRLIDRKVNPGKILWECEANELMESSFKMEEYARIHIPLMLMQYPYTKYTRNVEFKVDQRIYNYTGINYDINRLEYIVDVDHNSPAYAAGIRPRDIIEKIENHKMNRKPEEYTAAYKQFITNTMKYRDPETVFTDANGFRRCMYWDKFSYVQIADILQSAKSYSPFSYLFYYAPYVNPTGTNACTFRVKRGKESLDFVIRPTVHTETTVRVN